ncbi:MAG TPA: CocE/NonD family hydrolase, partial [Gemmatimonadaceae bacterium]|nr:CocE/NonD family hydrolase [Gemmatimonadaceae bacterium]
MTRTPAVLARLPVVRPVRACAAFLALALAPAAAAAQPLAWPDTAWLRAHYAKREVLIPMRDGVRLFTAIYTPRDTTKAYPILLTRTPYSAQPYGEDRYPRYLGPGPRFPELGYVFVTQDV